MVMKANRLSERPQAPTWEKTQEDVAGADPDDVVFSMGKDYLPHLSGLVYSYNSKLPFCW